MQINDILAETGGLQAIARELGISEAQVESGAAALSPAILGGFKKQVQSQPDGIAGLGDLLGQLGGGRLLDELLGQQPTDLSQGNGVLGRIFGSKDVSRTVSQAAARAQTGERLIYREVKAGRLKAARVGGRRELRLRDEWIDAWLGAKDRRFALSRSEERARQSMAGGRHPATCRARPPRPHQRRADVDVSVEHERRCI